MIIRFLIAFWILLQASVAGPSQQMLLAQKTATSGSISVTGAAKNSGTTSTLSATISPSSGELLVVFFVEYGTSAIDATVTDNLSSAGWTKAGSVLNTSSTGIGISCWYLANASASITTVTATRSTGSLDATICVHRVSGCSTSSPFTSGELSTNTGTAVTSGSTGNFTNATANSIFFAGIVNSSGANPATLTINSTGTTGTWDLYNSTNSQELNGTSFMTISCPNVIVSSSSARGHGWAFEASQRYAAMAVAFH